MLQRFEISEERGLVLARVPCEIAWTVIERLADHLVRATYSIRAEQLLIYFCDADRQAAQRVMDLCVDSRPGPGSVETPRGDAGGWMSHVLIGHYL